MRFFHVYGYTNIVQFFESYLKISLFLNNNRFYFFLIR